MKTQWIVPAMLGIALLSAPVLAATKKPGNEFSEKKPILQYAAMTSAEKCTALENQFDSAIKTHDAVAKAAEAKQLRTDGGSLCATGKAPDGVKKLETAIKALGLKPSA